MPSALENSQRIERELRTPPHSIEAEQSVLGGLMIDNQAWDKVADLLRPGDFYRPDHQLIFEAIGVLAEQRQPSDAVTVTEFLENRGELGKVGGLDYLTTLANETPSAANVVAYAKILRERSMLRALINVGNEIAGGAFAPDGRSADELVDDAERRVFEIAEKGNRRGGFRSLKDVLPATIDRLDLLHQSEGASPPVSPGLMK